MAELARVPQIVAIGASAGGIVAVFKILEGISADFPAPIVLVEHNRGSGAGGSLSQVFQRRLKIPAKEAEAGEEVKPGWLYVAPGGYHLLIEMTGELSLSVDEKVNWCRPAIDVFFESVAPAYGAKAMAIVLTGANRDGAAGAKLMQDRGAQIIIQDPEEAEFATMPRAAMEKVEPDRVFKLEEINRLLLAMQERSDVDR